MLADHPTPASTDRHTAQPCCVLPLASGVVHQTAPETADAALGQPADLTGCAENKTILIYVGQRAE